MIQNKRKNIINERQLCFLSGLSIGCLYTTEHIYKNTKRGMNRTTISIITYKPITPNKVSRKPNTIIINMSLPMLVISDGLSIFLYFIIN